MGNAKRSYKDTVFRSFFREKENFLALASAVTGEKFSPDEARENTVTDILFSRMRNDVSYLIGAASFIFFEHQSTWNGNMPLRLLLYLAELYKGIVPKDLIYREKTLGVPAPRFFGFYNGEKDMEEKATVRLSDAFREGAKSDIELSVTIYNINYEKGAQLLKDCRPMHDYSFFIREIREKEKQGGTREEAIEEAMRRCIKLDVMKSYLEKHWEEVFSMVSLKWNEADARESYYAQGVEDGMERGMERGIGIGMERGIERGMEAGMERGKEAMIHNMLLANTPMEYICKISGWTEEKIRSLQPVH